MTLLEALDGPTTPPRLARLSAQLGQSEAAVRSSLRAAFSTVLAGLLARADEPGVLQRAADLLGDAPADPTAGDPSARFLSAIFGERLDAVTAELAAAVGLRAEAGASLLREATPLLMDAMAARVRGAGLAGLTSVLAAERGDVLAALPPGLGQILGMGRPAGERWSGAGWLWPVAAALAIVGAWSLVQRATTPPRPESVMMIREAGDLVVHRLPGDVELRVPSAGLESELIAFLEENRPIEPPAWLDFDRLLFDAGKATLRPESRVQLANTAEILKAYPSVGAKIGGYTDDVGDADSNLALSRARATNVMNELVALGVPAARLAAEGYGEQHPLADNATDAGRSRNRRIALRVTRR